MRRVLGILAVVSVLGLGIGSAVANPFMPEAGEYWGEIANQVDAPAMCGGIYVGGGYRVSYLDDNTLQLVGFFVWDGVEYPTSVDICTLTGTSMHCDQGPDQIIDMTVWGIDAVVTNPVKDGVCIWETSTSYIEISPSAHMTCEGSQCDLAAEMIQGPGYSYPCNVPPSKIVYTKVQ